MATSRRVLDDARHTTSSKKEFRFQLLPAPQVPLYNQPQSMNSYLAMTPTSTSTVSGQARINHPPSSNPVVTHGYPHSFFYHHGTYQVGHPYPGFHVGNKRYRECMDYAHLGCRHFVPCGSSDGEFVKPRAPAEQVVRGGKRSRKSVSEAEETETVQVGFKEEQIQVKQEEISNSHEVTSSSAESGSEERELDPLELLAQVTMADMKVVGAETCSSSVVLEKSGTFVHGKIPFVRKKRSDAKQSRKVFASQIDGGKGAIVQSRRGRSQTLPSRFENSVIGSWRKGTRKRMCNRKN